MAYAGIQTLLLAYKQRQSDKQFELMQISNERKAVVAKGKEYTEDYSIAKGALNPDDVTYGDDLDDLANAYNMDMKEIALMEDELDDRKSNCETELNYISGYISSWEAALNQSIAKDHTYGATQ
ncbi:hypothetical protein IJ843_06435 [bacterium]|nr:hypothetical protein [bacterium]